VQKLPGWSYLLVGIALIGYSRFIETRTASTADPANLVVFFWIGVGFLVLGAYREFLPRLRRRKPAEPVSAGPPHHQSEPQNDHRHPAGQQMHGHSPHATHQHVPPHPHPSHPHQPQAKACPRCHNPVPYQNRFCGHCGYRFY